MTISVIRCLFLGMVFAVLLSGCTSFHAMSPLTSIENSLIFQPQDDSQGDWVPQGLSYENAHFEAPDGTKLHGWFVDHPNPRAIALFMHGNAGNITSRAGSLQILNERHRLAVMTFDYRGYGRSEGKPTIEGILEDARAARAWLAERKGVAAEDIVLMGRSLGGAVAVDLAAKDGARGLVLASTFSSLSDLGAAHFPLLPARRIMADRLDSLEKINFYRGPLLQSHGSADSVIPIELGRKLFEAAPGPKRFVTIEEAGHNDPQSEEYRKALSDFLKLLDPIKPPPGPADRPQAPPKVVR